MLAWIIVGVVVTVAVITFYALGRKGDVSASMSLLRIFEFKLDTKERRAPSSDEPRG
jgi:hypothetical protein